ncbi:MAG: hypothetical protein AW11_03753 [Candidatus Accumulibacter regalis]|jgi:hypothetical protein|uniref:Uncharacterized protein n=1 Tax=Accumulibacter regalis TaxID=522306 RepID=A0A011NPJ0_ACCRE|nr:hypothetical protein [Accumulibacter sp.]EXI84698.1 MAG: hypothetical protein AW11_03753 [Candidatus Accumulibacter regalis]HRE72522.1 hypothetical protein [Accumulibacter sp.]
MGKLFNLKKWMTVADAAQHLTNIFGEDVTKADVLRLALDGRLRLSIFVAYGCMYAKRVHKAPIPEFLTAKSENFSFFTNADWVHAVVVDQVFRLTGLLDLPMIDLDRLEIENEYRRMTNETRLMRVSGSLFYVEDAGQLYALYDQLDHQFSMEIDCPATVDEVMRRSAGTDYTETVELPEHPSSTVNPVNH